MMLLRYPNNRSKARVKRLMKRRGDFDFALAWWPVLPRKDGVKIFPVTRAEAIEHGLRFS